MPRTMSETAGEPLAFHRVDGNTWGILSDRPLREGSAVEIRKRNGEVVRVLVGRIARRVDVRYLYRQGVDEIELPLPPPVDGGRSQDGGDPQGPEVPPIGPRYQERVCVAIVALARGMSVRKAAQTAGLSQRRTRDLAARGARMTPEDVLAVVQAELHDGAVDAARTLRRIATNPTLDPFAQLRAASDILDRVLGKAAPPSRAPSQSDAPIAADAPSMADLESALRAAPPRPLEDVEE